VAARPALAKADGKSLVPQLRGLANAPDRPLYWHYPLPKPHFLGGRSAGAIRQGDYKLIEFFDDGSTELYNLKNDLSETQNLAAKQPAQAAQLLKQLRQWRAALPPTASTTR